MAESLLAFAQLHSKYIIAKLRLFGAFNEALLTDVFLCILMQSGGVQPAIRHA